MMTIKDIIELILSRYVVLVGGRYSRGKSLILTWLCLMDAIINNRLKIFSNMPLNFDETGFNIIVKPFIDTRFFDAIPQSINIIWDEPQNDIPARDFNSIKNKFISVFGVDIAKKDCRLRGTFQFGDSIDKNLGEYCDLIIIPNYINTYSKNTKEDNIIRFEKQDFLMNLRIIDRRIEENYYIQINLFPVLFFYNTKFKPFKLWLNHEDYVTKLQKKKGEYQEFLNHSPDEIFKRIDNWNDGLKNIGQKMIR